MNTQLKKRLLSFSWRVGMMVLAVVTSYVMSNLSIFNLNPEMTVLLGLILGEVSKAVNNALATEELG